MAKYNKSIAAVVGAIISAVVAALAGDNSINADEWILIAIAGTSAASIFTAPNVPGSRYTKAILAALMAVLSALTAMITDGVTTAEWFQVALSVLTALGVYEVANKPSTTRDEVRTFTTTNH